MKNTIRSGMIMTICLLSVTRAGAYVGDVGSVVFSATGPVPYSVTLGAVHLGDIIPWTVHTLPYTQDTGRGQCIRSLISPVFFQLTVGVTAYTRNSTGEKWRVGVDGAITDGDQYKYTTTGVTPLPPTLTCAALAAKGPVAGSDISGTVTVNGIDDTSPGIHTFHFNIYSTAMFYAGTNSADVPTKTQMDIMNPWASPVASYDINYRVDTPSCSLTTIDVDHGSLESTNFDGDVETTTPRFTCDGPIHATFTLTGPGGTSRHYDNAVTVPLGDGVDSALQISGYPVNWTTAVDFSMPTGGENYLYVKSTLHATGSGSPLGHKSGSAIVIMNMH
ncbi:PapG chaperone-binding domain-containing protein [Buttiauxella ferragutiae]|uniref:PapG chaperone-binding domain-containing protein n=1 Tax=Buttiauxella ferragutiae TaxID=82989 RepID=UPI0035231D31